MKHFSILANVHVTKNTLVLLSNTPRKRRVQLYKVNSLQGERTLLDVFSDETPNDKLNLDLARLYSVHKKYVNEGKATICFREERGLAVQKCRYV